jgi:hypothetical protein
MPSRFRHLPYDEALAQRVLDRIEGGQMLRDLWRDPSLPTRGDLRRWRHADPRFEARVRAAVNAARSRRMCTYSAHTADLICHRLIFGESLRDICRDPAMPHIVTVFDWLRARPDFVRSYQAARDLQAERLYGLGWAMMLAVKPETTQAAATDLAQLRWHTGKVGLKKYGR